MGGSFENNIKRGLFKDLREREGPLGNFAPPSSTYRQGKIEKGAMGAPAAMGLRPWGHGGGRG